MTEEDDDTLQRDESPEEGLLGTSVAGDTPRGPQAALEEPTEASMLGRLKWADLSPGTKYRLSKKKPGGRTIRFHWKAKKKKRRETYLRSERPSKLRRDRWLLTTPEGLCKHYRRLATRKGCSWDIPDTDFLEVLRTSVTPEGFPLYSRIFYIYRKAKQVRSYTLDSIYIVDRYSGEHYYPFT